MSRVITFSTYQPISTYPGMKFQKLTLFHEKILNSLGIDYLSEAYREMLWKLNTHKPEMEKILDNFWEGLVEEAQQRKEMKYHTIRKTTAWKAGKQFSPRTWSGLPYNSPQIIFAPDIEIKKVWPIVIFNSVIGLCVGDGTEESNRLLEVDEVAKNDGLSREDFDQWFKMKIGYRFHGQIICWNEKIEY